MPHFDLEARILLAEDGLIAVDKPAGLPSTGRTLSDPDCLQHHLMQHYRRKIWAVHQLDADTTGVNLFVRRKALVAQVAEKLGRGRKVYLALCHGRFEHRGWHRIDAPIGWVEARRARWISPQGKSAISDVRAVALSEGFSLLEVAIKTGRTHQVRIHMASVGHPLIGERRYKAPPCDLLGRHALHAHRVKLAGADIIEAPMPDDIQSLVEAF